MLFFVLSGECSLGAHGLLRFRTNDVLLGTSGVGCAYLLCLVPPVFILFFIFIHLFLAISVAEWTLPQTIIYSANFGRRPLGGRVASGSNLQH